MHPDPTKHVAELAAAAREMPLVLVGCTHHSGPENQAAAAPASHEARASVAKGICPLTLPNGRTPPNGKWSGMNHGNGKIWTALWPHDVVIATPDEIEKDGSIGREFQATEIRVLDQSGAEVLPGEVGEMVMRGPAVMQGYFQNPAASAAALRDGWLH